MADPQTTKSTQTVNTTRSPSGADLVSLILLILFGFGIWAVVERGFTELLRTREPNEQKIFDAHGVTKQKAELADVQNEMTEVQKHLNAARVDHLKQNAAVQSFIATYPDVATTPSPRASPPEIVRAYTETRRQAHLAGTVVATLEQRLAALKERSTTLTSELDTKTEPAKSQLRRDNFWYSLVKRTGTIVVSLGIFFGLLSLVRFVLWLLAAKKRMSTVEGFRPFVLAFAALALLFAYDQFSFAGAALVGVLLLLFILRRINWPRKSGVLVK